MEPADYTRDEDLIAETMADGSVRFRVEQVTQACVVLGRGSRAEVELTVEALEAPPVPVLRRRGGGCAVLLDPGNLVVSATARVPGYGLHGRLFDRLCAWVIQGLADAGIPGAVQRGTSDLALGDRKIGGSCLWRGKDILYFSTTIVVCPDIDLMERLLAHPPREPSWRGRRSHRDFVGSLDTDPATLSARLREVLEMPVLGPSPPR